MTSQPTTRHGLLRQISYRLFKMPKGLSTPGASTPVGQETEDAETRALASIADALEAHNKSATKRKSGASSTLSDGECCHREKYALFMEVERDVGIGRPVADRALPSYAWNGELIRTIWTGLSRIFPT